MSFALAAGNTNPQGTADPPPGSGHRESAFDAALLSLLDDYYLASARGSGGSAG